MPDDMTETTDARVAEVQRAAPDADGFAMMPRHATAAMMDAGLYNSSRDTEWEHVFTSWHSMWDAFLLESGQGGGGIPHRALPQPDASPVLPQQRSRRSPSRPPDGGPGMSGPTAPDPEMVERVASARKCARHNPKMRSCLYTDGVPCECRELTVALTPMLAERDADVERWKEAHRQTLAELHGAEHVINDFVGLRYAARKLVKGASGNGSQMTVGKVELDRLIAALVAPATPAAGDTDV